MYSPQGMATQHYNIYKSLSEHKFRLILCLILAFLYVLPLLLSDIYYIDDMRRSLNGIGWNYDGRPLSSFLMQKITGGGRITDYFPYSTILSACLITISGYIISNVLGLEKNRKYNISALILLINPFLLENLSYRWDSVPMAVSIFGATLPFLFISCRKIIFITVSAVGICITMLTYQPSIIIYPLIASTILVGYCLNNTENKVLAKYLILFLAGLISGLVGYLLINIISPVYSGDRSSLIFFSDNFINGLIDNCKDSWKLWGMAFSNYFKLLFILSFTISLIIYIRFIASPNRILNKLLLLFFAVITVILIPILFIILEKSNTGIEPRMLVGFPFLIYLVLIFIEKVSPKMTTFFSFLFIFISLPLMSSYANALKSQNRLEVYIAQKITQTINVNNRTLIFKGTLEYTPEISVATEKFPLLERLVPSYMSNNWVWGQLLFLKANNYMYSPLFPHNYHEYTDLLKDEELIPIIDDTRYYTLKADSVKVIVDFTNSKSKIKPYNLPIL